MDASASSVKASADTRALGVGAAATGSAFSRQSVGAGAAIAVALVFPYAALALGHDFYVGFATRVMIFVMAVTSLNLLVGYAGLVSLGHAAYFGLGAYAIAMLTVWSGKSGWLTSAWVAWPFAMACSALLALGVGAVALRTRHIYFLMVTLAFGQMVYYLFVGMSTFGSDNGMSLPARSGVGFGLDLADDRTFYYVVLALLLATLFGLRTLIGSRFGVAIRAIGVNESRMAAIGFPVFRYKLTCFVIAAAVAGLAGALLANQNSYVSPQMLDWTKSGSLLAMLILGGSGYLAGGIYGAAILLVLEEVLSGYTEYWQFFVGVGCVAVVLLGNAGVASLIHRPPRVSHLPKATDVPGVPG